MICLGGWGVYFKGRDRVLHIGVHITRKVIRGRAEEVQGVNPSHEEDQVNSEQARVVGRDGGYHVRKIANL